MLRNLEIGIAAKNLDKAGFLLDLFRNLCYNVKCKNIFKSIQETKGRNLINLGNCDSGIIMRSSC